MEDLIFRSARRDADRVRTRLQATEPACQATRRETGGRHSRLRRTGFRLQSKPMTCREPRWPSASSDLDANQERILPLHSSRMVTVSKEMLFSTARSSATAGRSCLPTARRGARDRSVRRPCCTSRRSRVGSLFFAERSTQSEPGLRGNNEHFPDLDRSSCVVRHTAERPGELEDVPAASYSASIDSRMIYRRATLFRISLTRHATTLRHRRPLAVAKVPAHPTRAHLEMVRVLLHPEGAPFLRDAEGACEGRGATAHASEMSAAVRSLLSQTAGVDGILRHGSIVSGAIEERDRAAHT